MVDQAKEFMLFKNLMCIANKWPQEMETMFPAMVPAMVPLLGKEAGCISELLNSELKCTEESLVTEKACAYANVEVENTSRCLSLLALSLLLHGHLYV